MTLKRAAVTSLLSFILLIVAFLGWIWPRPVELSFEGLISPGAIPRAYAEGAPGEGAPDAVQTVRVAVVQLESKNGDLHGNLEVATTLVEAAAQQGAQLILLPELTATGYELTEDLWKAAERSNGPTYNWLTKTSARLGLYLGTSYLEVDGDHFFNTFLLANPDGEVAGSVRKQTPAGAEGYFFRGEASDHVVETTFGRVGIGICQENYRCFLPRLFHQQRVDLILAPYSFPDLSASGGLASPPGSFVSSWYARQLGVPVLMANKTGDFRHEGRVLGEFPGQSAIVHATGHSAAELGSHAAFAVAEVRLDPGLKTTPDYGCVGPFVGELTLGGPFERLMTWAAIRLAERDGTMEQRIRGAYAANPRRMPAARSVE